MNSLQPPKCKCTLSPAHQAPHHVVTSDEEEDEIEDSNNSLSKPEEEPNTDTTGLAGHYTIIIILGHKLEDYATTLSRLQGLSLPIVVDEALFCSITGTMGLDIPTAELEDTAATLVRDFASVTPKALTKYLVHKNIMFNPAHASLSIIILGTWQLLLDDTAMVEKICGLCHIILLSKELDVSKKSFNSKTITIVESKTTEEREAKLHNQVSQECKQEVRAAEAQACQQCRADHQADNMATLTTYTQMASKATAKFSKLV